MGGGGEAGTVPERSAGLRRADAEDAVSWFLSFLSFGSPLPPVAADAPFHCSQGLALPRRHLAGRQPRVLEIGPRVLAAGSLEPSLPHAFPEAEACIGLDLEPGPVVDRILEDPDALPVADGGAGVVIASSCFEHAGVFWLTSWRCAASPAPRQACSTPTPLEGTSPPLSGGLTAGASISALSRSDPPWRSGAHQWPHA